MAHPVIHEDWFDYDNRKIRDGRDRSKFSCDQSWERDYLVDKLEKHFSDKSAEQIRGAIETCCHGNANREREAFINCVVNRMA